MKKYIIIFCLAFFTLSALPASAALNYPKVYKFYMELGKLAMEQGDYQEAYKNFRHAQAVEPDERAPVFYINLIKRLQDKRVEPEPATKVFRPFKKSRARIIDEALDDAQKLVPSRQGYQEKIPATKISQEPPRRTLKDFPKREASGVEVDFPKKEIVFTEKLSSLGREQDTVYLDNILWQTQPGTIVRVELRSSVILEGNNIKRYLIVNPGFIEVERIDKDRLNIVAKKRGSTFLHVWDDTGRWTLRMEIILPVRKARRRAIEGREGQQARPFKLSYLTDWSSYYRGPNYKDAERENLDFRQRILLDGETPYGDFDSHVIFTKFEESTEVTGYGVGLSDGKIGDFKDFSIRGFDLRKTFSPLSMPGQYVRGVLFEAKAFDKNLAYSYIHGQDRVIYGYLSSETTEDRDSYVEGARVTLFPEKENQYSVNYARGYGDARESFLKDEVISVEAQHRLKDILLSGEYAYNEDTQAAIARSVYAGENHKVTVSFRDIEKDFTTVTSFPGRRGEVGGSIFWDWKLSDINIDTYLDLYLERSQPNPEALDTVNVDFNTRIEVPISETDRVNASLYYTDTSGELSPRNNIQTSATYTKRFPFFNGRDLTAFVGASQQRSRFDNSPSSEYDRYSLSSGFSVPLLKHLNYYANYKQSLVYENQSGDLLKPNVLNTGLNFSKRLFDGWSLNSGFSYRNEENTGGRHSFLAGEDSITGSIGTTFRPNEDFEFFIDGRTRNIWGQEEDRVSYNEYDVHFGVRTAWEMPFRWNPKGTIRGVVYKDLNGNQHRDEGEQGIADVSVKVGKQKVVTNTNGYYESTIRAKSAGVTVDIDSIPDGFIFSTPVIVDVEIIPHKTQIVDFGLTTQSGIYGVVFYDKNGSGKPDSGDEFVAKTRIILDGHRTVVSDFEGAYFFDGIQPGAHEIAIDIDSLPIEYLPKIKLKDTIVTSEGSTYVYHIPLDKKEP